MTPRPVTLLHSEETIAPGMLAETFQRRDSPDRFTLVNGHIVWDAADDSFDPLPIGPFRTRELALMWIDRACRLPV